MFEKSVNFVDNNAGVSQLANSFPLPSGEFYTSKIGSLAFYVEDGKSDRLLFLIKTDNYYSDFNKTYATLLICPCGFINHFLYATHEKRRIKELDNQIYRYLKKLVKGK